MPSVASFARLAALLGNPARAAMLTALRDGRALTATELARAAGVAPQTGSGHLAQLSSAGLLSIERQGRHRYHRLVSREVALLIDGLMRAAAALPGRRRKSTVTAPRDSAPHAANTSFDYLASLLGATILSSIKRVGLVEATRDTSLLADLSAQFLRALGVTAPVGDAVTRVPRGAARPLARDWSERHRHLARAVGAAICRAASSVAGSGGSAKHARSKSRRWGWQRCGNNSGSSSTDDAHDRPKYQDRLQLRSAASRSPIAIRFR